MAGRPHIVSHPPSPRQQVETSAGGAGLTSNLSRCLPSAITVQSVQYGSCPPETAAETMRCSGNRKLLCSRLYLCSRCSTFFCRPAQLRSFTLWSTRKNTRVEISGVFYCLWVCVRIAAAISVWEGGAAWRKQLSSESYQLVVFCFSRRAFDDHRPLFCYNGRRKQRFALQERSSPSRLPGGVGFSQRAEDDTGKWYVAETKKRGKGKA